MRGFVRQAGVFMQPLRRLGLQSFLAHARTPTRTDTPQPYRRAFHPPARTFGRCAPQRAGSQMRVLCGAGRSIATDASDNALFLYSDKTIWRLTLENEDVAIWK